MPLLVPRYKGSRIARTVQTNNTKPHADVYETKHYTQLIEIVRKTKYRPTISP